MPARKRNDLPRPFLKWAGGKTQLLPQFQAYYPAKSLVKRYVEPFVGSGAVFFDVKRLLQPPTVVLADSNEELIGVYLAIQGEVEDVLGHLRHHERFHCREYYYRTREGKARYLSRAARAARFIYLNKTCFNGLYRVNSNGQFNVPLGDYKNPRIVDEDNLRAASLALRGVEFKAVHFRKTLTYAKRDDFIYFDPPYDPLSSTSNFTAYTQSQFGELEQKELARLYHQLDGIGCHVMLSNSATPLVLRLYENERFTINPVKARRSINSKADRRGPIQEVVVLNYNPFDVHPKEHRQEVRTTSATRRPGPRRARQGKSRRELRLP